MSLDESSVGLIVTAYEDNLIDYVQSYSSYIDLFQVPTVIVWSGDKVTNSPYIRRIKEFESNNKNIKLLLLPEPTKCLHARYEGYKKLIEEFPNIKLLQFIDCDDISPNIWNGSIIETILKVDLDADIYLSHYILNEDEFRRYLDYRYDKITMSEYGADCYSIYASNIGMIYKLFGQSEKISPVISKILNSPLVKVDRNYENSEGDDFNEPLVSNISVDFRNRLLNPTEISTLFGFGILEPVESENGVEINKDKLDNSYTYNGDSVNVDKRTIPSKSVMGQLDIGIKYPSIVTMPWKIDLVRETFEYIERNYTLDVNLGEDMLFHSVARYLLMKNFGQINCSFVPPYYKYHITRGSLSEDRSFKTIADLKRIETFVYDLLAKLQ